MKYNIYVYQLFSVMLLVMIANSRIFAQTQKPGVASQSNSDTTAATTGVIDSTINIGYGTQNIKTISSAISVVRGSELEKGFRLNLGSTLFGRLPGATILQGGSEPGTGTPTIYGRGINTFNGAGSQPLVVIDGFITGGSGAGSNFMQLVPEEVEMVTFLKDASATAVYGSRGANGVLLVTTKRGRESPLKISFTTRQGFNQPQFIPEQLNAYDYANLYNEALRNDGLPLRYTPEDLTAYKDNTDPYGHPNINWYDEVLRKTVPVSSYNLTFNGGDKTAKYFVLLNAIGSQGFFKNFGDINSQSTNSTYNRYNFRSNIDINLSKRLALNFNVAGAIENKNNPFDYTTASTFSLLASLPPNAFPVYNPDGSYSGSSTYGSNGVRSNPYANLLESGFYQTNSRTLQTALRLTEQLDMITPGLSITGAVSLNNYLNAGSQKNRNYAIYSLAGSTAAVKTPLGLSTSLSGLETISDEYRNYTIQGGFNYARVFGKHDLSAMALISTENASLPGDFGNATDPYITNMGAGRLTYVYNSKYVSEFSMGVTGSNNYGNGNRYGFFPAISLGWVVSGEDFLQKSNIINYLKIRGSYGLTGNNNTPGGRYQYDQNYQQGGTSGNYFFGTGNTSTNGYAQGTLANPNVTWEKEKSLNVGIDGTIFKNLSFSADIYNRDRENILVQPIGLVPQYVGITGIYPYYNIGKANNKGIEVSARYTSNAKKSFRYFVEGNVSYTKNKIVYSAEAFQPNTALYNTGNPIGQTYRLKAIGFFTQQEINMRTANPALYPAPTGIKVQAGDIKYQDIGGPNGVPDGTIDANDRMPTDNTEFPKLTAGFHSGFTFKAFDLDFQFQGVTQVSTYLSGSYFNAFQSNGGVSKIALGRWTPETAATATYPRLSSVNNQNNYLTSTFYTKDGSFIKLRSAELGYTLPNNLINRVKLQYARFFLTGTNLFSFDHIPYGDPESLSGYPVYRTWTLGLKIQL